MTEKSKIKVCMVVHQDYTIDGRVRSYTGFLNDTEAEIDVICVRNGKIRSGDQPVDQAKVYPIPLHRFASGVFYFFEYGISFVFYTIWLLFLHIKNRYDIIHVHNMPDFLIFSACIPRLLGAKLILDIHDPMPEFFMSKFNQDASSLLVKILRFQEKISTSFADTIIIANQNFKNTLIARGIPGEKITVIYNVPDPNIFSRSDFIKEDSSTFTLIYPGTIAPRYGLETAINAMPSLVKVMPSIRLWIIGFANEYVKNLKTLSSNLGVSGAVQFIPTVPYQEVPIYMRQADAGIYTALPDPHMDIAVPTKVLEYAIMGLPIITSRLTVLQQTFPDDSVIYFDPGNVDQFTDSVLSIIHDPKKRRTLIDNASNSIFQHRNWQIEQDKYKKILHKLSK